MTSLDNRTDIPADLLRGVSRSFYLTIRVLPRPVRGPIQLAYLLARAADTIADTGALPSSTRLEHLTGFREWLTNPRVERPPVLSATAKMQSPREDPETELLQAVPRLFDQLDNMSEDDRRNVQRTVNTLVRGMEFDLTTFPATGFGTDRRTRHYRRSRPVYLSRRWVRRRILDGRYDRPRPRGERMGQGAHGRYRGPVRKGASDDEYHPRRSQGP